MKDRIKKYTLIFLFVFCSTLIIAGTAVTAAYVSDSNTNSLKITSHTKQTVSAKASIDAVPPKCLYPVNNAIVVPVNRGIKITFSEPIKAGTYFQSITLKNSGGTPLAITKSITSNVLTIKLAKGDFQKGAKYTLTLPTKSINDMAGNGLTTASKVTFTVSAYPKTIDSFIKTAIMDKPIYFNVHAVQISKNTIIVELFGLYKASPNYQTTTLIKTGTNQITEIYKGGSHNTSSLLDVVNYYFKVWKPDLFK